MISTCRILQGHHFAASVIVFNVYRYVEIIPISFVDGPVCTAVDISIPIGAMNEEKEKKA